MSHRHFVFLSLSELFFSTYKFTYSISNAQKVAVMPVSATGMSHMAFWHKVVHSSTSAGGLFWPRYAALTLLRMRAHSSLEKGQAKDYCKCKVERSVEIIVRQMELNDEYKHISPSRM